jgi:hypothetical protein
MIELYLHFHDFLTLATGPKTILSHINFDCFFRGIERSEKTSFIIKNSSAGFRRFLKAG